MATPFGHVEKVVMMATKNQALLEFRDLAGAILMQNFYINTQPLVRGRKVYMRFSRHQALNTSGSSVNRVLLVTLSVLPGRLETVAALPCSLSNIDERPHTRAHTHTHTDRVGAGDTDHCRHRVANLFVLWLHRKDCGHHQKRYHHLLQR
jgi:hypothetical protein